MKQKLIIYPEFDTRIERDYMYSVSVTQGDKTASLPVYNHTEDSRVERNPVDDRRADEYRRFCTFAFEGDSVRVDIKVNRDFHDYTVMPSAKKFRHEFCDGVISVFLDHPDYFAVRLDGKDHTILSVLADAPETDIPAAGENVYIVDGWQEVEGGVLKLTQPNTTVYIPAGSVLNARIYITADNCRVLGRGAIVDPIGDIYRYSAAEATTSAVVLMQNVNNTVIDGIHMLDSKAFNIQVIGVWQESWSANTHITNVKILSTQMSSDGIACCYYAKDFCVEHCFLYCADNALVYEDGAHYKDITIGTTCNALYPQTDVIDSSVEDIYIFRADEGIINPSMGGEGGITKIENLTIKNLDAVDLTFAPYFLFVEFPQSNPVVSERGGITIENVRLPKLSDTRTGTFYRSIASGDCQITLKNVSIGGELIHELTPEAVGGEIVDGANIKYVTEGDFVPCVTPNRRTVDYKNAVNVFVGKYQVYFKHPIIGEGNDVLLPMEQLRAELRTECTAKSELRGGISYVHICDLTDSGMAKAISVEDNAVIITPNDNTGNLLLPDSGIISKYTEYICYASHLVVLDEGGETVYRIINSIKHKSVGIFRMLVEEVQKYGEGVYRLSFEIRSDRQEKIRAAVDYNVCDAAEKFFETDTDWRECSLDVNVGTEQLGAARIAMIIGCNGESALDVFDVKNISFIKIK